jgi:hypothetical protein
LFTDADLSGHMRHRAAGLNYQACSLLPKLRAIVLAINVPTLPKRGWYAFVGILTVIASVVTLVGSISSIAVLAITAGVWLVLIGITQVVWALGARRTINKAERRIGESSAPSAAG